MAGFKGPTSKRRGKMGGKEGERKDGRKKREGPYRHFFFITSPDQDPRPGPSLRIG